MGTTRIQRAIALSSITVAALAGCGDSSETTIATETTLGPRDAPSSTAAGIDDTADETGMAWRTVEVVDPTRPTDEVLAPDGSVVLEAADSRTIEVELLYEGTDGGGEGAGAADVDARPLVLWMNGLGGQAEVGDPILQALYEAGYVVAAPNSPEVSAPASSAADFPELPADISVVLDALFHPADGVADDLAPHVVSDGVGLIGHSIGSSAVRAAAFHDCCRDDRVAAVVSIGSNTGFRFGDTEFDYSGTPLLLVVGDADEISSLEQSELILAEAAEPTRLLVLPGADHFEPVYGGPESEAGSRTIEAVVTFFDAHVGSAGTAALEGFGADLPDGTWRSPAA